VVARQELPGDGGTVNMRPLLRLIRGEGKADDAEPNPRYRVIVDVEVDDADELLAFVEQMHRRWFTDEHAEAWKAGERDLGVSVAEALVVLNQNPPHIGLTLESVTVEELASTSPAS